MLIAFLIHTWSGENESINATGIHGWSVQPHDFVFFHCNEATLGRKRIKNEFATRIRIESERANGLGRKVFGFMEDLEVGRVTLLFSQFMEIA
jgi:hypothetical protein